MLLVSSLLVIQPIFMKIQPAMVQTNLALERTPIHSAGELCRQTAYLKKKKVLYGKNRLR